MSYVVIECHGYASGIPCPYNGQYLEWYDPFLPASTDLGGWTPDVELAKRYPNIEAAIYEWQLSRGKRLDGLPDRPLTAFNVHFVYLGEENG